MSIPPLKPSAPPAPQALEEAMARLEQRQEDLLDRNARGRMALRERELRMLEQQRLAPSIHQMRRSQVAFLQQTNQRPKRSD